MIWNPTSWSCLKTIDIGTGIPDISFDPTDRYLLTDIGRIHIATAPVWFSCRICSIEISHVCMTLFDTYRLRCRSNSISPSSCHLFICLLSLDRYSPIGVPVLLIHVAACNTASGSQPSPTSSAIALWDFSSAISLHMTVSSNIIASLSVILATLIARRPPTRLLLIRLSRLVHSTVPAGARGTKSYKTSK
ncbi:hypothetical protein QBC40DRAFT_88587 [Triangularia verruculosa]|uniref:Uncharacterized protein n=1 Tax=Triangularia verruculosa TaxID=2587418 RepID=A0AAN6XDS3_9PEZI|nr:hypothetical protein QBC40DRAFT_88587 [Triangularia verruculosa]